MANQTEIKKLEQGRAEFAYRCVKKAINEHLKESAVNCIKKDKENQEISQDRINEFKSNPGEFKKKKDLSDTEKRLIKNYENLLKTYLSYSRKIPQMILTNGLGQTLAFVKSKAKDGNAYDILYSQMTDYLKSNNTTRIKIPSENNDLVGWVISCDSTTYRYITQEFLAFLNWLKRFAEGMIEGDADE